MLIIFFNICRVLHPGTLIPKGQTINAQFYLSALTCLREDIHQKDLNHGTKAVECFITMHPLIRVYELYQFLTCNNPSSPPQSLYLALCNYFFSEDENQSEGSQFWNSGQDPAWIAEGASHASKIGLLGSFPSGKHTGSKHCCTRRLLSERWWPYLNKEILCM